MLKVTIFIQQPGEDGMLVMPEPILISDKNAEEILVKPRLRQCDVSCRAIIERLDYLKNIVDNNTTSAMRIE